MVMRVKGNLKLKAYQIISSLHKIFFQEMQSLKVMHAVSAFRNQNTVEMS